MSYPHKIVAANKSDDTLTLGVRCPICREQKELIVPRSGYYRWTEDGLYIQAAMPTVSKDEREMLISGTCGECWTKLFSSPI